MNRKKRIIFLFLIIIALIIIVTIIINFYMINTTKSQILDIKQINEVENVDAILILGCKANSDGPSLMLSKRLDKGIELYNQLKTKILLSGDHGKDSYDEVNTMRDYLLSLGIAENDIFLDHAGFNTYDSVYRAKYIFDAKKIIIVTQRYHMYRALYLANKLELDAVGVLADDIPQKGIMIKNEIREILSRDKNFFKAIFKPQSKYLGEKISLNQDGNVTNG